MTDESGGGNSDAKIGLKNTIQERIRSLSVGANNISKADINEIIGIETTKNNNPRRATTY